jgi:hypothetical protein
MVIKKDLVIAVLAAFCVTATLFVIMPTRSSPQGYDPWLDVNEDGTINILDISAMAKAFMTTGDPTKNVNVTNFPVAQPLPIHKISIYKSINYSWTNFGNLAYYNITSGTTEDFSRMSIQITVYNWSTSSPTWVNVSCNGINWIIHTPDGPYGTPVTSVPFQPISFYANGTQITTLVGLSDIIETLAPYYSLDFTVKSQSQSGWVLMDVYVYLRNE